MPPPKLSFPSSGQSLAERETLFAGSRAEFETLLLGWDEHCVRRHAAALDEELSLAIDAMVAAHGELMSWRLRGELSHHALFCWSFGYVGMQASVLAALQIVRGEHLMLPATLRMLGESEAVMILSVLESEFERMQKLDPTSWQPNAFGRLAQRKVAKQLSDVIGFSSETYRVRSASWKKTNAGSHSNLIAVILTSRELPESSSMLGGEWDESKLPMQRNALSLLRSGLASIRETAHRAAPILTPEAIA